MENLIKKICVDQILPTNLKENVKQFMNQIYEVLLTATLKAR